MKILLLTLALATGFLSTAAWADQSNRASQAWGMLNQSGTDSALRHKLEGENANFVAAAANGQLYNSSGAIYTIGSQTVISTTNMGGEQSVTINGNTLTATTSGSTLTTNGQINGRSPGSVQTVK